MKIWPAPCGLHIEEAQFDDAKILAKLHQGEFYRSWTEVEFASMLRDNKNYLCLIACDGKRKIAGFAIIRIINDESELLTIIVSKKWRKKGIGSALISAIIDYLTMFAVTKFFLEVAPDNKRAINLYRKFAFIEVGERKSYYRAEGQISKNALIMRKDID